MFLSLDPGLTTGWCMFSDNGVIDELGQVVGVDEFILWLETLDPKPSLIICEDFVLNPNIPQGGSQMEAPQVIGAVKSYASKTGIVCVIQAPRLKKIGYAWAGTRPPSKKADTHRMDAYAHGVYYLVLHDILKIMPIKRYSK